MQLFFLAAGCADIESGKAIAVTDWRISSNSARINNPVGIREWDSYEKGSPLNRDVITFNVKDDETVWLRGDFELKRINPCSYRIMIGGRGRSSEVYVNSFQLTPERAHPLNNIHSPAQYAVASDRLNQGLNTLYVRTSLLAGYSAVTDNISVLDADGYFRASAFHEIIFTIFPLAILIFIVILFVFTSLSFIKYRRIRIFGFSALVLLFIGCYDLAQFLPKSCAGAMIPRIHFALFPVFGLLLVMSAQSLYRIYLTTANRILAAVCLGSSALIMLVDRKISEIYAPYLLLFGIVWIAAVAIFILRVVNRIRRDRPLYWMMAVFSLAVVAIGLLEIIPYLMDSRFVFLYGVYATPFIVMMFIIFAGRDFMKSWIRMRLLYNTIRPQEKKDKDTIITDTAEGKLNSVIAFINVNFTQDISREGLAGAIDMNTDYMSRLFRKYTGKKINEYINEMRIREAEKLLRDKNIKIIDIALSVGFESLSTFNRVFKNINGETPSDYRNRC